MTPSQMAKSNTEAAHQRALMAYIAFAKNQGFENAQLWANGLKISSVSEPLLELHWFHSIHNQGHGDAIRGANAKAEGIKAGVYDCFLPITCRKYAGLYIEMKKPSVKPKKATSKDGRSDYQIEFGAFAETQGYKTALCYSWDEAANEIKQYMEVDRYE